MVKTTEFILDVRIDNLTKNEIMAMISQFMTDGQFHQIATVGPEFILRAQKNSKFKEILNNCDLNVADSIGIKFAFIRFGNKLKFRFPGVDLMHEILKIANNRGLGVFLACRKDGLSNFQEVKKAIHKLYPKLNIGGLDLEINDSCIIHDTSYMIHLCNFGAPDQEIFLNSLKNDIIGIAMGVGGSFDFITGKVRRAPLFIQSLGLEWLWRLILQPWEQKGKRLRRIWNTVIVFPIKIIFCK